MDETSVVVLGIGHLRLWHGKLQNGFCDNSPVENLTDDSARPNKQFYKKISIAGTIEHLCHEKKNTPKQNKSIVKSSVGRIF